MVSNFSKGLALVTSENSFARAAYTKKQEFLNAGVPENEIDIQRIDNEEDLKSTWEMWSEYELVEGLHIYSHGYPDGISVAGGGGEFISNTIKLNWGSKLRTQKVNGESYPVKIAPYTVFHGCNTANGSFAQEYANTQEVITYAQSGYASFSKTPTTHIPIEDKSTKGNVYLYHFNLKNLINTNGNGKKFNPQ